MLVGFTVVLIGFVDSVVAAIVEVTCEFHSEVVLAVVVGDSSNDVDDILAVVGLFDIVLSREVVVVVMDVVVAS